MSKVFTWPIRVYYEDTDAGGVVYHARYLHFLERARTEWLRSLGDEQDDLARRVGILFVVRRLEAEYLHPAHFNEQLLIQSQIANLRRVSMSFIQNIHLTRDNSLLLTAQVQIVCLGNADRRPHPIPEPLLKIIHNEL